MYETPEKLALETLKRVAELGTPSVVLWIRTGVLLSSPGAERLMHVIDHLLAPLLAQEYCRLFTFENQDKLLIGVGLNGSQLQDVMRQIQTFIRIQTESQEGTIRLFHLPQDLMEILPFMQGTSEPRKVFEDALFLQDIPEKNIWMRGGVYQKKQGVSLWGYSWSLKPFVEQIPVWLAQKIGARFLNKPNENLFNKNYPFLVSGTLESSWILENKPAYVKIDISEVLLNPQGYREALMRSDRRYRLGIEGITSRINFYDFKTLAADFLLLPANFCLTNPKPELPVFVTQVDTQECLTQILASSYTLFQGDFIDLMQAAMRKKSCPYGEDCALQTCVRMGIQPHQASQCVCVQHLRGDDAI